ncbi:MAG: RNA methyltransferase [Limnohabitans sp.]|nr:RNA methyltransferase [Limnohabitans sp.]
MVSKNQIKLITSLTQKKFRKEHNLFIAEGIKVIQELLDASYELVDLFYINDTFPSVEDSKKTQISGQELKKISSLTSPNNSLAIFKIPLLRTPKKEGLIIALDDIRDPGNLGTIIRLCDWFGINQLICSEETVDAYNPKVVQATMGSLSRVNINYVDLKKFISNSKIPVFGTFMEGDNIYKNCLPNEGIIVLGNEANGISKEVENLVTQKISIPRFGDTQATESLNVATATAIILSEFRRNS